LASSLHGESPHGRRSPRSTSSCGADLQAESMMARSERCAEGQGGGVRIPFPTRGRSRRRCCRCWQPDRIPGNENRGSPPAFEAQHDAAIARLATSSGCRMGRSPLRKYPADGQALIENQGNFIRGRGTFRRTSGDSITVLRRKCGPMVLLPPGGGANPPFPRSLCPSTRRCDNSTCSGSL
jgi:hypothetical protein